jgi:hypothetical protein
MYKGGTMENLHPAARERVLHVLAGCTDLTLATIRPDGSPQATAVSFVNRGLAIYAGIGLDSQKAHNIQRCGKVSLALNLPYADWGHILGISAAASAAIVSGGDALASVEDAMILKFPQIEAIRARGQAAGWGSLVVIRIVPHIISLLDYSKGFGHTELYAVQPGAIGEA